MTPKEIRGYEETLAKILKEPDANERLNNLTELAKEVGASTQGLSMWDDPDRAGVSEGNLVANIHNALQTATMIDMCKTASRNYFIALIATIIALGSAIALWISVCK